MAREFRSASDISTNFCAIFPKLASAVWSIKSPRDDRYQCIAWAACRTNIRWWPVHGYKQYHWPPDATFDDTVDAFVEAFATLGYHKCTSRQFEFGYQKVAMYVSHERRVLHMARQHFFGHGWLSKCGDLEDISHAELESIEGDLSPLMITMGRSYGVVDDTILTRTWWSACIHLCIFRSARSAFIHWLYRMSFWHV